MRLVLFVEVLVGVVVDFVVALMGAAGEFWVAVGAAVSAGSGSAAIVADGGAFTGFEAADCSTIGAESCGMAESIGAAIGFLSLLITKNAIPKTRRTTTPIKTAKKPIRGVAGAGFG